MRFLSFPIFLSILIISCTPERKTSDCVCDPLALTSRLSSALPDTLTIEDFYKLDSKTNQQLWFADIGHIDSTRYTRLWNDYQENNFHASHEVFRNHYRELPDTELAFQIGPAGPLWTYYTFVLKKQDCCFVLTRTSFVHARFRYKAFAILNEQKTDSLFSFLTTFDKTETEEDASLMKASFIDNRKNELFEVVMDKFSAADEPLPPDSSVIRFLDFVDTKIKWTETYPLKKENKP